MRCIEICTFKKRGISAPKINRNMRCIEIPVGIAIFPLKPTRLIETWDVLKWNQEEILSNLSRRLIETWDVLKS